MYKYCVVVVLVQLLYAAVLKLLSSYDILATRINHGHT